MGSLNRWLAVAAVLSVISLDARGDEQGPLLQAQAETGSRGFVLPPAPDEDPGIESQSPAGRDVPPARPDAEQADPSSSARPDDPSASAPAAGNTQNYLGVFTDPVPPALAAQFADVLGEGEGLLVTSIVGGAAADQAGLRVNDLLVSYDGQRLATPEDLKRLVVSDEPGATVDLEIIRAARRETVRVTLGQRTLAPPPAHDAAGPVPAERGPFPIGIHLPGPRSIVIDRYGLRSPWVAVDWGSPLAGRRFQALTPGGRQFEVEVRVRRDRDWRD